MVINSNIDDNVLTELITSLFCPSNHKANGWLNLYARCVADR